MPIKIGEVAALYRYPVKSMGGERLEVAGVGWHGLEGDRRLAFRRSDDRSGFPWLTASRLPELVLFAPKPSGGAGEGIPTHVRTPDGASLEVSGLELAADVGRRYGAPVEMVHLNRGIFDEASVSLISIATVEEIGRLVSQQPDVRRFRPNIVLAPVEPVAFGEERWVGGVLSFGEPQEAAIFVTNHDERCAMVNIDPDSARLDPEVLKAIVRARDNKAGIYGAVTRKGRVTVGQPVFFEPVPVHR